MSSLKKSYFFSNKIVTGNKNESSKTIFLSKRQGVMKPNFLLLLKVELEKSCDFYRLIVGINTFINYKKNFNFVKWSIFINYKLLVIKQCKLNLLVIK